MQPRLYAVAFVMCVALVWAGLGVLAPAHPKGLVSLEKHSSVGEGLERVDIEYDLPNRKHGRVHIIYADPAKVDIALELNPAKKPISTFAQGARVAANAAFFTPDFKPTGLLVSNGNLIHPFIREAGAAGSGVFVLESQPELIERDSVGSRSFSAARIALQAGPRIIEKDGSPGIRSDDGIGAHRTVLGTDGRGFVALAVALSGSEPWAGPTLFEMQRILGPEGLGKTDRPEFMFRFALNLDGGPSTGLEVRDPENGLTIPERSPVLSVLTMRVRK